MKKIKLMLIALFMIGNIAAEESAHIYLVRPLILEQQWLLCMVEKSTTKCSIG